MTATSRSGRLSSRCGLVWFVFVHEVESKYTPEPPATGKTCETCLRLSRRDA